jgi:hypothetical protein
MDIYLQVSDEKQRTLTLDGDLDLLDRLLETIKAGHNDQRTDKPAELPRDSIGAIIREGALRGNG